jgi:hypothetical protein
MERSAGLVGCFLRLLHDARPGSWQWRVSLSALQAGVSGQQQPALGKQNAAIEGEILPCESPKNLQDRYQNSHLSSFLDAVSEDEHGIRSCFHIQSGRRCSSMPMIVVLVQHR